MADCPDMCEAFEHLANALTGLIDDETPCETPEDALAALLSALASLGSFTWGDWTFTFVPDTLILVTSAAGSSFKVTLPVEGSLEEADPPKIVPSVGDPSHWESNPIGFSFWLQDCGDATPETVAPDEWPPLLPTTPMPVTYDGMPGGSPLYMSVHAKLYECTYEVEVPGDAVALLVRLARTRTTICSVHVDPGPHLNPQQFPFLLPFPLPALPQSTNLLLFDVRRAHLPGAPRAPVVKLRFLFHGDPPMIGDTTILHQEAGEGEPAYFPQVALPRRFPLTESSINKLLRRAERNLAEEWDIRREWANVEDPTPSQRAHQLFLQMDEQSLGKSMDVGDGAKELSFLGSFLTSRYMARGRSFRASSRKTLEERLPLTLKDSWTEILRDVGSEMYTWLTSIPATDDDSPVERRSIDDIREAFGLFAVGQVNAFDAHGAPNGVNMFSFAELAFLLTDHEAELGLVTDEGDVGNFWPAMAEIFTAACQMFVHCYHKGPRAVCGYKVEHNPVALDRDGLATPDVRPEKTLDDEQRTEIFDEWSGLDRDEQRLQFGELVYRALRNEFGRKPSGIKSGPIGGFDVF